MKKTLILFSVLLFTTSDCFSQNLMNERIRQISGRKKSIFLDKGIFHNGGPKGPSSLKSVRHSFKKEQNFERVVMDFGTNNIPRVYGHISSQKRKVYIDLFKTKLNSKIKSFGESKYIKAINFYPIDGKTLSVEIDFKKDISVDIFSLKNPGRLVIDVKG